MDSMVQAYNTGEVVCNARDQFHCTSGPRVHVLKSTDDMRGYSGQW